MLGFTLSGSFLLFRLNSYNVKEGCTDTVFQTRQFLCLLSYNPTSVTFSVNEPCVFWVEGEVHHVAYRILVPPPRMEPSPPAVEAQS